MPPGKEVGLGPGHIVLDGDPATTATPPHFWPMPIMAKGRPSQQLLSSCKFSSAFYTIGFRLLPSHCWPAIIAVAKTLLKSE